MEAAKTIRTRWVISIAGFSVREELVLGGIVARKAGYWLCFCGVVRPLSEPAEIKSPYCPPLSYLYGGAYIV